MLIVQTTCGDAHPKGQTDAVPRCLRPAESGVLSHSPIANSTVQPLDDRMRTARKAKVLANSLADNLAAGGQDPTDHQCLRRGAKAIQETAAICRRHAGHSHIILCDGALATCSADHGVDDRRS